MNKLDYLISTREKKLKNGAHSFSNIYTIIFSDPTLLLFEYEQDYHTVKLTYGEVDSRIRDLSYSLSERIGKDYCGSYVGLEMENCPEWIMCFWALLMAGYKPLLINCKLPKTINEQMLETSKTRYILSMNSSGLDAQNILVSELTQKAPSSYCGSWADEISLSTTATSLHPKLCVYTGREIAAQILNTAPILNENKCMKAFYHRQLKQLAFLPFYHVFGLFATYFWFTFFGRAFVFLPDYSGEAILRTVRKHEVTHIFAVPLLWHSITKAIRKSVHDKGEKTEKKFEKALKLSTKLQNFSPKLGKFFAKLLLKQVRQEVFGDSIRFMISGGSYLRNDSLYMLNALGYSLHNGYGMSEIGICSVELREKPKYKNENSIGRPFLSVSYEIPDGNEGELHVKGDSLCIGYYKDGEYISRDSSSFATGDLVRRGENGYYYFSGRTSELVIGPNGENVSPDEVERHLDIPLARRMCVLGLGALGQEELCLVVEVSALMPQVQRRKLLACVQEQNARLSSAERLQKIYFTENAIASENAIKVSRSALLRMLETGKVTLIDASEFCKKDANEQSDLDDIGIAVREVFAKVLDLSADAIGADDHFIFDLGGSSLDYFTLQGALNERFDVRLQIEADQCRYTVNEISGQILELLK